MNFSLYIAKRYLLARKSHTAINIISLISVIGVATGTMALVVVLSVFNGFDQLVRSLFNSFDPDLKITLVEGKVFSPDSAFLKQLGSINGVQAYSLILEENALLRYRDQQYIAIVKGVSENYQQVTGIDTMIVDGRFQLHKGDIPHAIVGQGVAYFLSMRLNFIDPLMIYVPKRQKSIQLNPESAFNRKFIYAAGIFAIEQDVDSKYLLVPLSFMRQLLNYTSEVSAIELKLTPTSNLPTVQQQVQQLTGSGFKVQNRLQQKELFYKIMKSEKWAIFFILSFILIVASFNIIGTLTMLIIEKSQDIKLLHALGVTRGGLRRIFLAEGMLVVSFGAIAGLALGAIICWVQIHFGLVQLNGSGSFIIDAYPVKMVASDFVLILGTVLTIGFLAAWYPVRFISNKFFLNPEK